MSTNNESTQGAKIIGIDEFENEQSDQEQKTIAEQMDETNPKPPSDAPKSALLSWQYRKIENDILESIITKVKMSGKSLGNSEQDVQQNLQFLTSNINNILENKLKFEILAKLGVDDVKDLIDEEFTQSVKDSFKF